MGAVVTRKEISSAVKHMWFNTFAAGHLQTRIAVETLNVLKREKLA
jgi:4-aminobutyrate aminotransferase-like enzyme